MPSDDIDREILLRIPNAGDMSDDELAQALLGIDWVSADGEPSPTPSPLGDGSLFGSPFIDPFRSPFATPFQS